MSLLWFLLLAGTAYAVPLPWDTEWTDSLDHTRAGRDDTCSCGWTNKGRIVGGKETLKNEFPFMVSLQKNNFPICGATIITPWHVLTAAHCTHGKSASVLKVVVGAHNLKSYGGVEYGISKIFNHEKLNLQQATNDIALIVTTNQISFSQNVGPACLPTRRLDLVGETLKAIGWGRTSDMGYSSNVLKKVDLKVVNFNGCLKIWKETPSEFNEKRTTIPVESMNVCTFAQREDTCAGDSGGPLVWLNPSSNRYTIAALVSYGGICGGKLPAVNTDVSAFIDWINQKISATGKGVQACSKA